MNVIIILYTRKIIELSLNFAAYLFCQEEDSVLIDRVMVHCETHTGGVFSSFLDSYQHMSRNEMKDAERVWTIVRSARKAMIFGALVEARQSAGNIYETDPADFIETLNMEAAIELHNNVISPTFFQFCRLQGNGFKVEHFDESMFCENNKEVMRCQPNL